MAEPSPFSAGIVDYNPKRMSAEEAQGIPDEYKVFLADHRQYPINIARHFPGGVAWFDSQTPWFFREAFSDPERMRRLTNSDALILSGSGLSAYRYQEGNSQGYQEGDAELIAKSEQLIRDHLGEGKWVLGICYGGQIGIKAIGGRIGRLPENAHGNAATEAGWLDHELTDAGQKDEVFGSLPKIFSAPHFHNDYVAKLPRVGQIVKTHSGKLTVTKAEVLAVRHGYSDREGLMNPNKEFIQASLVELDNGARLYQIQPHPEMATSEKANFLVSKNPWLAREDEMGKDYFRKAMVVPTGADFAATQVIRRFVEAAKKHAELVDARTFTDSAITYEFLRYAI